MRSVVRAGRYLGVAIAVIVAPLFALDTAEMTCFWIGHKWSFGATRPDTAAVQNLVFATGFLAHLAAAVAIAWLLGRRNWHGVKPSLAPVRSLARGLARGYVWFAMGLIVAGIVGGIWWDAWMYRGWAQPPEVLHWIDSGDGEGACVRIELEMMIWAFTAWIAMSAVGRLGLAGLRRSRRTCRTA